MNEEEEAEPQPRELVTCRSVAELVDRLTMQLGFPYVEARRLVLRFGAGRCEGALLKTLHDAREGGIRRPRGWFITTLRKGLEWTAEEVRLYVSWQQEAELRRMEESGDVTMRRLAEERRRSLAARDAAAITSSPDAASPTTPASWPSSGGLSG